jgi:3-oxoacyl-[acyl-carrier-protein] synthase-3
VTPGAPALTGRPVTITGIGTCLPERVVTNDELSLTLDTSDEWITKRTGIRTRRIAAEGVAASDLGVPAARRALERAGLAVTDVGLVLMATISPDNAMPASASRVAYGIGAVNAGACDLSAGCSGFVYALAMATGQVASGLHDHVLVVGAEVISRILDWQDRGTAILFGDAGGAVVVSASTSNGRILGFDLGTDGSGADLLSIPAGGSRLPASHETVEARQHFIRMKGNEVYRFATRVIPESVERVLAATGRSIGEIDLLVPHQANMRIIEAARRKLGIAADRVFTNLQRYGNTSCASIPLCLDEARESGRLQPGHLVLLMGFGAGLTWGSCLMEWGGA